MSNSTSSDAGSGFEPYDYDPSTAAAILFAVLFAITTIVHTWQFLRTRTWFMIPFCLGGICEVLGYIGRTISASESPGPYEQAPYILQSVTIIVAPALLAASIYMELGRIVLMLHADAQLFIRRTWLTKIFVCGDVISFITQGAGAGMLANVDTAQTGRDVILVGLFVQVVFFGLFVLAAGVFHLRVSQQTTKEVQNRPWKKHMLSLYTVSLMIFVRSIVRVVEFIQGADGYIGSHEVFLYVFDAMLMFFAMVVMNWIHPGEVAKYNRQDREEDAGKESAVGV